MKRTLKIIAGFIALTTALIVLSFLFAGVWTHVYGKTWLVNKMQKDYQIQLSMDRLRSNFFNTLTADGIEINHPVALRVERATLSFQPWDLINPKRKFRNIFFLHLEEAVGRVDLDEMVSRQTKSTAPLMAIPVPLTVLIQSSAMDLVYAGETIRIHSIQGEIRPERSTMRAHLTGEGEHLGRVETSMIWDPHGERTLLTLRAHRLDTEKLSTWLRDRWKTEYGYLSGILDCEFKYDPKNLWRIEVRSSRVGWKKSQTSIPTFFKLAVVGSPGLIHISDLSWNDSFAIKGQIRDPMTSRELDLTATFKNLSVSHLRDLLGWDMDPESQLGVISATATVNGSAHDPSVTAAFHLTPQWGRIRLPKMEGDFRYHQNRFVSNAVWGSGRLKSDIVLESYKPFNGRLQVSRINFQEFASLNGWDNVSGVFSAELAIKNGELFSGPFKLEHLTWGRNRIDEDISGMFHLSGTQLVLDTQDDRLGVQADLGDNKIEIGRFNVDFGNNSSLTGQGTINARANELNVSLKGLNLQADLWPPLVAAFPSISGGMDLDGVFFGSMDELQAKTDLVFHGLQFFPKGEFWNGKAEAAWDGRDLVLKNIHIDGGYEGNIRFCRGLGEPSWFFDLVMTNADPRLLADLTRSSRTVKGTLNGGVNLHWKKSSFKGVSTVTWSSGQLDRFTFDSAHGNLMFDDQTIQLRELSIIDGHQVLRGDARIVKGPNQIWDYHTTLQIQQVGGDIVRFDGEINGDGSFSWPLETIKGEFDSSVVYLNGTPLETFQLRFNKSGRTLEVTGSSPPFLDIRLRAALDTGKLRGTIRSQSLDIGDIYKKYYTALGFEDIPSGVGDIDVKLAGTWRDPLIEAQVSVPDGIWRNERLSTKAALSINRSTLTIKSARMEFENGGEVYAQGAVALEGPYPMSITGAGTDLNLQTLVHLMNWKLKWDGRTQLKFSVEGTPDQRIIECVIDGEHNGFAPFAGGGAINGKAVWSKGEWILSGVSVHAGDGFVRLLKGSRVIVNRDETGLMRLVLDVRNLRTGVLSLFGGVELTGSWSESKSKDERDAFTVVGMDVYARSLWVNQVLLNGNISRLTIDRKRLLFSPVVSSNQQISGALNYVDPEDLRAEKIRFRDEKGERLFLDGHIGKKKWDFSLSAKNIDAQFIRGLLDTTFPVTGPMALELKGDGTALSPILKGTLVWRDGRFGLIPIDVATCDLHLENSLLTISNLLALKKKGYQVKGIITTGLMREESGKRHGTEVDLQIEKGDFSILREMWPVVNRSKGSFEGEIKFKDTIRGHLSASDVSFRSSSYIPYLRNGNFKIEADGDTLKIVSGRARLDKGTVELTGYIEHENGLPSVYDLRLNTVSGTGPSVRVPILSIPPGALISRFSLLSRKLGDVTRGEPIINVSLTGPSYEPVLSGEAVLENAVFTFPGGARNPHPNPGPLLRWWRGFLNTLHYDLVLQAGHRTRYENEYVNVRVDGQLKFEGSKSDLILNGRINSDQGSIVYGGNEFKLNEAQMEIVTPKPVADEPSNTLVYLKASAERDVYYTDIRGQGNQDTIVMEVDRSLIGELQPRFYSRTNPNVSPDKALRLALGVDAPGSTPEDSFFHGTGAPGSGAVDVNQALRLGLVQLLDSNLASPMARALARETGLVDYIRVTYEDQRFSPDAPVDPTEPTSSGVNSPTQNEWLRYIRGTKVKFGRELSSRLFADYSFKVDEYQQQVDLRHEVELAYRVHKNLFIRAISELDSQQTLGRQPDRRAVLENQWRFGLPRPKQTPAPYLHEIPPRD